jgi:hypothetical protein
MYADSAVGGPTRGAVHPTRRRVPPCLDVRLELIHPLNTHLRKRPYVLKKGFNKKFGYPKGYTYIHALMENKTTKEK